jgi:hypothetical protein
MGKISGLFLNCLLKINIFKDLNSSDTILLIVLIIILMQILKSTNLLKKFYYKITKNNNLVNIDDLNNNDISKGDSCKKDTLKEDSSKKDTSKEDSSKEDTFKENIKMIYKKKDDQEKENNPYPNHKDSLKKNYSNKKNNSNFVVNVNSTICSTPIFNLRTYYDLDFHYNFLIHNFCPKQINNLIMCKDIHQWMSTSSLSNDDLKDELVPIYFILNKNDITDVFEYLKLFIKTDNNGVKMVLVQKGDDYLFIKDYINKLKDMNLIHDLLSDEDYNVYNLSTHEDVTKFLTNFLSLVLIPEHCIGEEINLNIENLCENINTFEYFFNTVNSDISMFNTTL